MIDRKTYSSRWHLAHREQQNAKARAWYFANLEQAKENQRKFRMENPGYVKAYRLAHPEQEKEKQKKYRLANKKRRNEASRTWNRTHPERMKKNKTRWEKSLKGKEVKAMMHAKRKQFGFTPLNKPFDGSRGHHIDEKHVIHIPVEIHESVSHSVLRNQNMPEINYHALNWLEAEELYANY